MEAAMSQHPIIRVSVRGEEIASISATSVGQHKGTTALLPTLRELQSRVNQVLTELTQHDQARLQARAAADEDGEEEDEDEDESQLNDPSETANSENSGCDRTSDVAGKTVVGNVLTVTNTEHSTEEKCDASKRKPALISDLEQEGQVKCVKKIKS